MAEKLFLLGFLLFLYFSSCTCACHDKVDLAFLVDSSGSVGSANFVKVKNFVASSLNRFIIGNRDTLASVATFSSTPHEEVKLNSFHDKLSLINAINGIRYISGGTNTGQALKFVGSNIFQPSSGDRIDARNVLVVITDGRSNNHLATIAEANHLKHNNILIIAVGIGSGISKSELAAIASRPSLVLHVEDFNALSHIYDSIHSIACSSVTTIHPTLKVTTTTTAVPTTTDAPTTTTTKNSCVDVIPNCDKYGPTVCIGTYKPWASRNCAYYCKLCNGTVNGYVF
ncbi:collagen alpha-1(XII) chain-like [Mytilus trossulus]|uniref:collagen alpha-1(XII) chain-like n=1 Tax=Mytilus trossulus TaxID=6551 RepID=UPI003005EAFA